MTAPLRLTDRKRESIVLAAIAEFRDNGFEVTSMDRIAARAEVSKRTVYNHFPSKEELFSEILHRLWANASDQPDASYRPGVALRDQLREMLKAKMKTLSDSNFIDLARVAIGATIHSPDRAQTWVNRVDSRRPAGRPPESSGPRFCRLPDSCADEGLRLLAASDLERAATDA
jgi:TetR/AcrR family transcriptional regulator of autoinduction and epiphytic fitness